jgi:hypothetical protein
MLGYLGQRADLDAIIDGLYVWGDRRLPDCLSINPAEDEDDTPAD